MERRARWGSIVSQLGTGLSAWFLAVLYGSMAGSLFPTPDIGAAEIVPAFLLVGTLTAVAAGFANGPLVVGYAAAFWEFGEGRARYARLRWVEGFLQWAIVSSIFAAIFGSTLKSPIQGLLILSFASVLACLAHFGWGSILHILERPRVATATAILLVASLGFFSGNLGDGAVVAAAVMAVGVSSLAVALIARYPVASVLNRTGQFESLQRAMVVVDLVELANASSFPSIRAERPSLNRGSLPLPIWRLKVAFSAKFPRSAIRLVSSLAIAAIAIGVVESGGIRWFVIAICAAIATIELFPIGFDLREAHKTVRIGNAAVAVAAPSIVVAGAMFIFAALSSGSAVETFVFSSIVTATTMSFILAPPLDYGSVLVGANPQMVGALLLARLGAAAVVILAAMSATAVVTGSEGPALEQVPHTAAWILLACLYAIPLGLAFRLMART